MTDVRETVGESPTAPDPPHAIAARLGGVRAWSLAMSFLGDCVAPRGGEVGIATIAELLGAFGVDNGATRTAMSRLAHDGWVSRTKAGRNSFYALTPAALASSERASRRIYAARHPEEPCRWRIVWAGGLGKDEQARVKTALRREGAAELASQTYLLPAEADVRPDAFGGLVMTTEPLPDGEARRLVERAFDLASLAGDYAKFVAAFAPVRESLRTNALAGVEAVAMRVLVIHAFRRIVLRDPMIPAAYLSPDWPGFAARAVAVAIWRTLLRPSEDWLDANAACVLGRLPSRDGPALHAFSA